MLGILIQFLIFMLILGVIYWATTLFPLPAPIPKIIQVVVVIVFVIGLISILLAVSGAGGLGYGLRGPLLR